MSATAATRTASPDRRVFELARAARSGLSCDGVVVAATPRGAPAEIVLADGVSDGVREAIRRAADQGELGSGRSVRIDLGAYGASGADGRTWLALCAPLRVDGPSVGTFVALHREGELRSADLEVATAFGRHFAVLLDTRTQTGSSPEGLLALLERLGEGRIESLQELNATLDMALEPFLGKARTGLALWDEERGGLTMIANSFDGEATIEGLKTNELRSSTVRVFLTGAPYITAHATRDPGSLAENAKPLQVERILQIQIRVRERPTGVLTVATDAPAFPSLRTLEEFGPHLGLFVDRTEALTRARRRADLIAAVYSFAVAVAAGEDPGARLGGAFAALAQALCARLVGFVPTEGPTITNRDGALEELDLGALAAATAQLPNGGASATGPVDTPGLLLAPAHVGGEFFGTVVALRESRAPFPPDEQEALARVANLTALSHASVRRRAQRLEVEKLQERQRIADSLHDETAQLLFGAQMSLETMLASGSLDAAASASVERARSLVAEANAMTRYAIERLAEPAPDLLRGLVEVVERTERDHGLEVRVAISDSAARAAESLDEASAISLTRAARESLVNVAKHARSPSAEIALRVRGSALELTISDSGSSTSPAARGGYGIASVKRSVEAVGGRLQSSYRETGSTLRVTLPLRGRGGWGQAPARATARGSGFRANP